ncbi:hypothetical protein HDV00_008603 [Rhizophlyctis rosea]|nr:hypothetical protein HDV00_008603 [Rhizophlyctis rosea]
MPKRSRQNRAARAVHPYGKKGEKASSTTGIARHTTRSTSYTPTVTPPIPVQIFDRNCKEEGVDRASSPLPTKGTIKSDADAYTLFDAARRNLIPRVRGRLGARATKQLEIRTGSVFVYSESESGILRW